MGARRARSEAGVAAPRLLLSEVSQAGAASPARAGAVAVQGPAGLEARQEISMARAIRAHCLACGQSAADIALMIHSQCGPAFGTRLVRAQRLALGIALADVVAQVRARYVNEGRTAPRFSETLLSSYEGGQKRPGPEYLHYLCCVYQAEPADLGYEGPCLCGQRHRAPVLTLSGPAPAAAPEPGGTGWSAGHSGAVPGAGLTAPPILTAVPSAGEADAGGARCPPARSGRREADRAHRHAIACAGAAWSGPACAGCRPAAQAGLPAPAQPRAGLPATTGPGRRAPAGAGSAGAPVAGPAGRPGSGSRSSPDAGPAHPGQPSVGEVDDDVVRRTLLRLMADPGAAVDGRFFGAVERIRRRLDEALLGATVSVAMLDHWEGMTGEYGRQYMTVPPMRLLCDVLLDLGDVRRMCEQRQPLEFVERLCRLAARLAGLAGMTMIDAGDHRLARSFFSTARTAADETGDRHLRAWVAVRESLVPLYYGDPAQAAAAARAAADLAGHQPCVAGVMAPVVEARALARLARARSGGNMRGDIRRAGRRGRGRGTPGQRGPGPGARGARPAARGGAAGHRVRVHRASVAVPPGRRAGDPGR